MAKTTWLMAAAGLAAMLAQPAAAQEKRSAIRIGVLTDMSGGLADVAVGGERMAGMPGQEVG